MVTGWPSAFTRPARLPACSASVGTRPALIAELLLRVHWYETKKFGPRGSQRPILIGPCSVATPVKSLNAGFGGSMPLREYGRAFSAELSSVAANPPVYKALLPERVFPKAEFVAYCEVAALLTLPCTRNPSALCWFSSCGSFGISAPLPCVGCCSGFLAKAAAGAGGTSIADFSCCACARICPGGN